MQDNGIRVELDNRNEKIGYKVREARQVNKVPYMLIIGKKEIEEGTVSVRDRDTDQTTTMPFDEFLEKNGDKPLCFFTTKSDRIYTERDFEHGDAWLVFGKESKGLPETLLCSREADTVRIPMTPFKRSLNLSNSVAIAVYEVLRQRGFSEMKTEGERLRMLNSLDIK